MRAVLHFLFAIPIGFVLACFGGAFLLLSPYQSLPSLAEINPIELFDFTVLLTMQAAQIGSMALLPWAIFMVITELSGWRSFLLHALAGIAGGFTFIRIAYRGAMPSMSIQTAIILSGLVFAMIYWLVAGRTAGRWRASDAGQHQLESEG